MIASTGCVQTRAEDPLDGGAGGTAASSSGPSTTGPGSASSGQTGDGGTSAAAESGADGESSGEDDVIKLDVGGGADIPVGCAADDTCGGCTAVDILFVIDNSGSMGTYQEALGLAFPGFAQTLADALPPGTNVHVAVTSTEMAYSSAGNTSITNGVCQFIGDGDQTNEAFYLPPTQMDTMRNGAQGRLWDAGGGSTFFEFNTDGDVAGAQAWFANAANIGEGGSNIEMYAAPVGWVFDPVNAATNDGFLRDEGAVLAVFFLGDEPDQSPGMVDGGPTGQWVLDRVAEAKAGCGGLDCVIVGGFLEENACAADGNLPLDDVLAGADETPVVGSLPGGFNLDPQALADDMNDLLSSTLTEVIAQTCDEITPEG
ncbi:MAG: vWA domain-containing protein [Myxococcota bacterium]